jgi:hypothetical protein
VGNRAPLRRIQKIQVRAGPSLPYIRYANESDVLTSCFICPVIFILERVDGGRERESFIKIKYEYAAAEQAA